MKLDKNSSTASYIQIANHLRSEILGGIYAPGSRLPTETELMAQSARSRITVRQALKMLEDEGWLERKQGIGTFVRKAISQELSNVQTITEVMKAKGLTPRVKVLGFGAVVPPEIVAQAMQLEPKEKLLLIERLYHDQNQPIARLQTFLPLALEDKVDALRQDDIQSETTYTILERRLGIRLAGAQLKLRAIKADAKDAACLGIPEGDPVLVVDRKTLAADGRVAEYTILRYHWERYEFSVDVPRELNR